MKISTVADVDAIWPSIAPQIAKCLEKTPSYISAGEFWQLCRSGQAFLIVAHTDTGVKGASIWQFHHGYGRHVFDCLMVVGTDAREWTSDLFEYAAVLARSNGAAALAGTGRLGLVQILKKYVPGLKVARQSYLVEV
jgi:hypothetical protein